MSAIQELAPYISAYQGSIKRAKEDQHYTIDRHLLRIRRFQIGCDEAACAGTQQDPKLYNSAALCRVLGLSLDELFGLVKPAESPEELTEQIHHVELENAKLEATAAAQSAQIRSTHTMCYVLALFCMLLSFSLIACLVTDAQIRSTGLIRDGDLSVAAWVCIALIVGSALASAITFYAIRKERGGKHGVHQV